MKTTCAGCHSCPTCITPSVKWAHRKVPLSHGRHSCGRVPWQPPALSVDVESGLEARLVRVLINLPDLVALHSQPFTLSYQDRGETRRYTPDFLSVLRRVPSKLKRRGFGLWTVIEVKALELLTRDREDVYRRLDAVRRHLGFGTVCLTEIEIEELGADHES